MAYIKIFPIKSTVKKAVAYITNPDKTDEQKLVSSFGCSPETADLEFAMTAEMGKNNVMEKGDNLAWHMIISYHPNDLTDPKLAHEVSTKIADSVLKGKYEYVLTTHTDKKHIHSHLIFNATSFTDYHKYVSNKRTYTNSARSVTASAKNMGCLLLCQLLKPDVPIKKIWNISEDRAGRQN